MKTKFVTKDGMAFINAEDFPEDKSFIIIKSMIVKQEGELIIIHKLDVTYDEFLKLKD